MEKNINIKITSRADGKGFDVTTTGLKKVQRESKKTHRSVSMVDKSINSLVKRITRWGGGLFVASTGFSALTRAIGSLDTLKEASGRLKLVTASTYELSHAKEELLKISNNARVGYTSSVNLYARLGRSLKELHVPQNKLLQATEAINKSLIISGSSAASAEAALIQLGQGFAAGALRGQELMSVMEQTPRLAEAIANGMGIGIGELKILGEQGKLTAEAVFNAILKQKSILEEEFKQMPKTIGQSLMVLKNNFIDKLENFDKSTGFTKNLASAITLLSENIGTLINTFGFALKHGMALGASFVAAKVATLAFGKASKLTATTSLSVFIASLKTTKTRTDLVKAGLYKTRTALRALKATFATFAPTAALFALTEALFFFLDNGADKADKFRNSISKTTEELEKMSKVSLNAYIGGKDGLEAKLRFKNEEIQRVEKELHRLDNMLKGKKAKYKLADGTLTSDYQQTGKYKDLLHELEQLQGGAKKVQDEIFEAKKALNSIGKREPSSNSKIDTSEVANYTKALLSPYQAELDKINETNLERLGLLKKAGADTSEFLKAWELEVKKLDKKYEKKPTESKKSTTPIKNYIGEAEELLKGHYERVGDIESLHVKEKEKFSAKVLANTKLTQQQKTDIITSFSKKLTEDFTKRKEEETKKAREEVLKQRDTLITSFEEAGNYQESWTLKRAKLQESLVNVEKNTAQKMLAIAKAEYFEKIEEEQRKREKAYGKVAQGFTEGLAYAEQHLNKLPSEFEKGINIADSAVKTLQTSFTDFFDKQNKNFLDFGKIGKNVLNDIANKMLKMQVIDPLAKAGGKVVNSIFGAVFGSLWSGEKGGFTGYAQGGYTANVGVREIAGVVHGGEYVVPAWQVQKNRELMVALEAERTGKRGFWRGGFSGGRLGDRDGNYSTLGGGTGNVRDGLNRIEKAIDRINSSVRDRDKNEDRNKAGITKEKSFLEALIGGDWKQTLGHVGNFLMDAVFTIGGSFLGSPLGGVGAKLGEVGGKKLSDYLQEEYLGWKDGDPSKKIETFAKELSKQSSNISETQKGAKHVLETSSKMLDTVAQIQKYQSSDNGKDTYKVEINSLKNTYKEQQQQMFTSMQKDVIRNAELLYKDIFAVTAPKLKEGANLNFQQLFKNYTEKGNSALTKTVLDGSLFNTPNFYKTWEEYARTKNKKIDEVLGEAINSIAKTRQDFTKWTLKDNAQALAKYNAQMAQQQFQTIASQMSVNFASLTAENFLTKYNEAVANNFDPQIIENWNNLGNAFKNASDAQANYTNAVQASANAMLQKAQNLQSQMMSMLNTLGRDATAYAKKSAYANAITYVKQNFQGYENATTSDVKGWINTLKGLSNEQLSNYIGANKEQAGMAKHLERIINLEKQARPKVSSYTPSYVNSSTYKATKALDFKALDSFISALRKTTSAFEDIAKSAQNVLDDLYKHDKEYTKQAYRKHINQVDTFAAKILKNPLDEKLANDYKTAVDNARKYARDFLQDKNFETEWDYRVALGEAKRDWQSIKKQGKNADDMSAMLNVLKELRDNAKNQNQINSATAKATNDLNFLVEAIAKGRVVIKVETA